MNWLVSSHAHDVSDQSDESCAVCIKNTTHTKVPQLFQALKNDIFKFNDFARCSMTVRDLYLNGAKTKS